MPVIHHEIFIQAPPEVCFDLARDVDVHTRTTSETGEKAVGGVITGLLEKGDAVTWEATHFKIRQRLTAEIVQMDRPHSFTDVMIKGAFASFTHTHEFRRKGNGTIMTDTFDYRSPFGVLGRLADRVFLETYMKRFIVSRAKALKKMAEEKA
ncbi:cell division protein [Alteribacter lacisalsi]|uniref:Cell division protein n=1 Tax=Alteribacter lacisalsi TaxID=2045244 RepID=A0A2W0HJF1_9BACI|nr:SRPBCC family protein [Alteribacter lacisalsi]PYZ97625.1 cell division protein [Alteribacter lacisalsi]